MPSRLRPEYTSRSVELLDEPGNDGGTGIDVMDGGLAEDVSGEGSDEDLPPERRTGFGDFGPGLLDDIVTRQFVRGRLNDALATLLSSASLPPGFAANVTSARVDSVALISDDGVERSFAVTIGVQLEADVGPRLFALGVDARVKIDITVRVRAFRPATVGFDIDPITPNDVWFRARTRSGWLPFSLGDGGVSGLSRSAQRVVPKLCTMVNEALEAAVERRRLDVLAFLHGYSDPARPQLAARRPRAGRPIPFSELGQVLLHRGIDRRLVAAVVGTQLAEPVPVDVVEPVPVSGSLRFEVAGVSPLAAPPDQLRFRLTVMVDADLRVGAGPAPTPATARLRADVALSLTTQTNPSTLVVACEPLTRLRVLRVRWGVRGRMVPIPLPDTALRQLRRRATEEVNRRLVEGSARIVVADLVTRAIVDGAVPPPHTG